MCLQLPWLSVMVVSETSAIGNCDESVGCRETDHISIARPSDMQHSTLTSKIKQAMQDVCGVGIQTVFLCLVRMYILVECTARIWGVESSHWHDDHCFFLSVAVVQPPAVICTRRLGTGSICGNILYSEEALVHDGEHKWQLEGGDKHEKAR